MVVKMSHFQNVSVWPRSSRIGNFIRSHRLTIPRIEISDQRRDWPKWGVLKLAQKIGFFLFLLAIWVGSATIVLSDDDTMDLDDVLEGFEEASLSQSDAPIEKEESHKPQIVDLDGYIKLLSAWNFEQAAPGPGQPDHRGISMFRPEALIELKVNLPRQWRLHAGGHFFYDAVYLFKDDEAFNNDYLETYQSEAEWHEVYISGKLGSHLDLKIGRQIAVWGRSDMIRVVDCLNPLDMRYPGMTDFADLRLPVTMTRLDGYLGPFNLGLFAIHEPRFDKEPVFGSDFYPAAAPAPEADLPGWEPDNTQWAAALGGIFHGVDVAPLLGESIQRPCPC